MMTSSDPEDEEYRVNSTSPELKFEDEAPTPSVSIQNSTTSSTTSSTRPQQQRRGRILISQSDYTESTVDTFEEAFSKHRHAGSFKLKFGTGDEFASPGASINNADANKPLESPIMTNDAKDTDVAESSFIESDSSSNVMFVRPVDEFPKAVDQELTATVKVPNNSTTRKRQIRIFSSQGHNQNNADYSFEEAFSRNKYASSFRLRFRDEVIPQRNIAQVNSIDATETETLILHDNIDIQELSEPATSPCQQTVTHDSELETECENGSTNLMTAVDDTVIAVQENNVIMNGR